VDDGLAIDNFTIQATATPEPATWAMMVMGVFAMGLMQWKRKQNGAAATSAVASNDSTIL
jgi:hypothetical protein